MEDNAIDHGAAATRRSGHLHRVTSKLSVRVIRHRTHQQTASTQIQHRSQEELALVGGDLNDVAALKSRLSRSGNFATFLSWRVNPLDRFGLRPCSPCRRMDSATVFTPTFQPSSSKSAWMRGEP
jgi:hypothetical protein